MDKCKNFFVIYGRFWYMPSKRFASPDLVEPSFDSWRGVTVNFFMSIALAEEVFKKRYNSKQVRAATNEISHEFLPHAKWKGY